MAGPVAADLPPLLPTPALPMTSRLFLPPSPVLSTYTSRRDWDGKKPGRATSSQSWIRDKIGSGGDGGGASWGRSRDRAKIPGRASSSESWIRDKMDGTESKESGERVGRAASRESWKRPPSRAPSVDQCGKKPRLPTEAIVALEAQPYAGPTFIISPEPSELPIPSFVKAH